jgi:hypothetical protein
MKQEQYEKVKAEMRAKCDAAGKTKGADYAKECEVAFAEWTTDEQLRQTTFLGWLLALMGISSFGYLGAS